MQFAGDTRTARSGYDVIETPSGPERLAEPVHSKRARCDRGAGLRGKRVVDGNGTDAVLRAVGVRDHRAARSQERRARQDVGLDAFGERVRQRTFITFLLRRVQVLEIQSERYAQPTRTVR